MKRKKSENDTKVFTFGLPFGPLGCSHPDPDKDLIDEQIFQARLYTTLLKRIEIARRAEIARLQGESDLLAPLDARITALLAELDGERAALNRTRQEVRKRVVDLDATRRIDALKRELRTARESRKQSKATVNTQLRDQYKAVDARANELVRAARALTPLYWGSYLLVEKAMEAYRKPGSRPPVLRRWDGSGRIGVQLQGGLTVAKAFGCRDTRLRLDLTPTASVTMGKANPGAAPARARKHSGTLHIRIDSAGKGGREPVWATFPAVFHPRNRGKVNEHVLPPDGVIKWAWVQRQRVGTRMVWQLQIALEAPSFRAAPPPSARGAVAVDFGAKGPGGDRRVAFAVDECGNVEHFAVPERVGKKLEKSESLRSIRDREFDQIRERLVAWREANKLPTWLAEELRHLHAWRSTAKLSMVVRRWRDARFDGDAMIFAAVDAWRRQDRHLYQWEVGEKRRALAHRLDAYRNWAAKLAGKYERVILERVDFSSIARNATPEQDNRRDHAHGTRVDAAPSELRQCIVNALGKERVTWLDPAGRARICPACGADDVGDVANGVIDHACGAVIDADYARCWLLLGDAGVDTKEVRAAWTRAQELIKTMRKRVA